MESNPPDSADMQSDTKVAILHLGILRRIFKNGMINVAQNPEIGYWLTTEAGSVKAVIFDSIGPLGGGLSIE